MTNRSRRDFLKTSVSAGGFCMVSSSTAARALSAQRLWPSSGRLEPFPLACVRLSAGMFRDQDKFQAKDMAVHAQRTVLERSKRVPQVCIVGVSYTRLNLRLQVGPSWTCISPKIGFVAAPPISKQTQHLVDDGRAQAQASGTALLSPRPPRSRTLDSSQASSLLKERCRHGWLGLA
jgi:hypothetical protein